jgi:RNA polymerase sigma-70 factor (ECF subfamily)
MVVSQKEQVPLDSEPDFDAVYRAHAARVARWSARLGGPTIDVDDAVQEVFLVVHRQLSKFRGDAQITTWLYRITENVVRHRRRKERIRRWLRGSAHDVGAKLVSSRPTPVEELERRQALQKVYRILDSMNERYRTLLILFELEELSGEEIAELTGTGVDALWVALHRAHAQFVQRMEHEP